MRYFVGTISMLSLALAFVAATGSSASAQVLYSGQYPLWDSAGGPRPYYPGHIYDIAPGRTGGGSYGYNQQVEEDY